MRPELLEALVRDLFGKEAETVLRRIRHHPSQRVVVTGIGVVAPNGIGKDAFWEALAQGRSGTRTIDRFDPSPYPSRVAGLVQGFDPRDYLDRKEARRMSRASQMAVAAARMALEDAGFEITPQNRERVGVLMSTGNGSFPETEEALRTMIEKGGMRISPFFVPIMLPNMPAAQIAMQLGAIGYTNTTVTACAAGNQAIGEAAAAIRRGEADVILAGGAEAPICEFGLASFVAMRALSTHNDPPEKASRPFDATRTGFVPAEGAAVLVLERLDHALRRGARIYAEVAGFGATADGYHLTAPDPEGRGAVRAMKLALADAGVHPEEVDYINAHGTGTPLNDPAETRAIKAALGEEVARRVPISSTKSMTGHLLGAAGAVEAAACLLAMEHRFIPPTINLEHPDPECDLDYVPNVGRPKELRVVMSNGFGFGGQNAVVVFRKYEGEGEI